MKKFNLYKDSNRLIITIDSPDAEAIERIKKLFEQEVLEIFGLDTPPSAVQELPPAQKVEPINLSAEAKSGEYKGKTLEWFYENKLDYLILNITHKPTMLNQFLVAKDDFIERVVNVAQNSKESLISVCSMLKANDAPIDNVLVQMGKTAIADLNSTEKEELILFIRRFLVERRYTLDGTME